MPMHIMRRPGVAANSAWIETNSRGVVESWVCHDDEVDRLLEGVDPADAAWHLRRLKRVLAGWNFKRELDSFGDRF